MVFFNYALRKLNAKIVYYGPGLCGKTTNLQWIHDHFEGGQRGKMISLATEGDRTIFFDLLPIDIGAIRGMDVTLQLYTVPGQVHYNSTRQLVLRGADGVVFVADSQRTMRSSNVESFENLQENLMLQGIDIKDFPHILQFNKRDLRDLLSTEDLNENLNVFSCPIFEAIATEGIGVQESLEGIVKLVMRNLREKYEPVANASGPQAPSPMQVTGPTAFQPPAVETGTAAPKPPASDFVSQVEPPSVADSLDELGATFTVPPIEIPTTVAPPNDETQAVGPDSGFAAFQDEDGVPTAVYEEGATDIAKYEAALGSSDFAGDGPSFTADQESSIDETPTQGSDGFEGLFTDPRDEDGTSEGEAVPKPADPVDEPEAIEDLQTDPEFSADDLQSEPPPEVIEDLQTDSEFVDDLESDSPPESIDDLFETEVPDVRTFVDDAIDAVVAESTDPDDFVNVPEVVVAPPSTDRYEDRIKAPGPFAPTPASEEEIDAEVDDVVVSAEAGQIEAEEQAVHDEVRQALGASEDRVALASLSDGVRDELIEPTEDDHEPEEVQPVVPPPPEEPAFADTTDTTDTIDAEVDVAVPFFETVEDAEIEDAIALGKPATAELEIAEPDFLEPEISEPDVSEPDVAEPEIVEPDFVEPEIVEPDVSEPDDAEPDLLETEISEPDTAEPEAAEFVAEVPEIEAPVHVEVEVEEIVAETPLMVEPVDEESSMPPTDILDDAPAKSRQIVFGSGDPFASDEVEPAVVEVLPEEAPIVPVSNRFDVTAEDNQLHLQLKGSGAIAEMGQVRALDIEVPVPGQWVGNRKVTLQLRLTLTPAEDEND